MNSFDFTAAQLSLIKSTYAKDCTDDEFALFIQVAQRTGLDPFSRQIYAIKRAGKMVIQTSIDGYRLIADRGGNYAGNDEAVFVHNAEGGLMRASVKVWKFVKGVRCDFTAMADWDEYVQLDSKGVITSMWATKRYIMLAKCAEAQALRKAFPADLSGLYTHEEMGQADNVPVAKVAPRVLRGPVVKDLQPPLSVEETKALRLPDTMGEVPGGVTNEQLARIVALKKAAKFTPEESLQWGLMIQSEYAVKGPKDLTSEQADIIILDLQQLGGK